MSAALLFPLLAVCLLGALVRAPLTTLLVVGATGAALAHDALTLPSALTGPIESVHTDMEGWQNATTSRFACQRLAVQAASSEDTQQLAAAEQACAPVWGAGP